MQGHQSKSRDDELVRSENNLFVYCHNFLNLGVTIEQIEGFELDIDKK